MNTNHFCAVAETNQAETNQATKLSFMKMINNENNTCLQPNFTKRDLNIQLELTDVA